MVARIEKETLEIIVVFTYPSVGNKRLVVSHRMNMQHSSSALVDLLASGS